jgi:ribose transport system substrate-binding protein
MKPALTLSLLLSLGLAAGCSGADEQVGAVAPSARPKLAFVTNCVAEFWTIAAHGARASEREFDVEVSVQMPPNGTAEEQQRILEDLLAKGVQGIAVSPKDPDNMTALLDRVAGRVPLVTHDSDAPQSKRLAYVGMDNYDAGRLCGQLIAQSAPGGGAVVILVGTLDQDNARGRRQGLIDELLGRSHDPKRFDPQNAVLKGDRWEIRATFTDDFDHSKCKATAQDALTRWQDLAVMVGLFEYEPPLILEAVEEAGRLGAIAVVAFDENERTLQGIVDGKVRGTIVQNPYEYAHRSLELLSRLVREPDPQRRAALLPQKGFIDIPARRIDQGNVRAFWDDLRAKTGKQ